MSQDRSIHQLATPKNGHIIVFKDWINGREKQSIDGAMFRSITTTGDGKNMKPQMNETMLAGQENAGIEAVVVSVDGNDSNVLETVLDMHSKDFEFITKHVETIVSGDFDEKKENSSEENTSESSSAPAIVEESATASSL